MATAPVRFGLVGYGMGGRLFHAPLIASAPGCQLAGVVTRSPLRRDELARDHPGTPAYDTLADLAGAGVAAVAISTPTATHTALAQQAIGLGLAVVSDKPFALDAAAARETTELAGRLGTVLSVYHNRRWDSDFLTLRRLIEAGELGSVHRFESRFERFRPAVSPRAAGGGVLLDLGSHLVDQALTLFGPVDRVYAELHVRDDTGRDDDAFVALHHRNGVLAHLWMSAIQGAPGPRLRVAGTTGSYLVDLLDGQEEALRAGRSPATDGDRWGAEPEQRWGQIRRGATTEPVPSARGRWDTFYPAFAGAVRGEGPVPVDPWDSVAGLEILDAARAAATSGQLVTGGMGDPRAQPGTG
jgi:predicted dehydrogenase